MHTKIKVMEKNDKPTKDEIRENRELVSHEANQLRADGKKRHNESTRKINKLWLWLGVIILIFILLWWLWSIGIFNDLSGN